MFALMFSVGKRVCGIDLKNVVTVSPAFDLISDSTRPLPFVGWHCDGTRRLPAFDLNYAIAAVPARRLLGTRHILSAVKFGRSDMRIVLVAEGVSQVVSFAESDTFVENGRKFAKIGADKMELVELEKLLGGSLFEYGK